MQVSIETTAGLERRLTIGLPAEQIDNEVLERLQKASKTVRIDGFRQGKVPLKVVRQRFGSGVRREVVGEVLNSSFYDAVAQHKLRPAGFPAIERIKDEPGQDLEYVATFEVYPEIDLIDFSSLEVIKPVAEITDADVDKVVESLRKQRAKWVPVERVAADGDQVNIDFTGTRDGEEFEGGKAVGMDLILGSGRMLPGFEAGLAGLSAGEQKIVSLTAPEDYRVAELRGAALTFDVKVNAVCESQPASLDQDFFALFAVNDGGEQAFRDKVRDNMARELARATTGKIKTRLMNLLYERHDISLPKALLANEIQGLREHMLAQFGGAQQFDPALLPDDIFIDQAKRRVTLGLLVVEIAKAGNLSVDGDRVRARVEEIAATYEKPEQVVNHYFRDERLLGSVQAAVMEDQVVDYLLGRVRVSEQPVSYEDVLKPDPQPAVPESAEGGGEEVGEGGEGRE